MNYFKTMTEIALFKGKPHDIAYNVTYLIVAYLIVLFVSTLAAKAVGAIDSPVNYVFTRFTLLGGFLYLVLLASKKSPRFTQSASALYGIIALSQTSAYLFIFILKASNFAVVIYLWSAAVQVYIFRETLECKTLKALALYAGIQFSINLLLLMLFPELLETFQNSLEQSAQNSSR